MTAPSENELDFAHLARLAREDPDAFESLRLELIRDLIESAPQDHRRRLAGLQWQIDQVRRRAGTPLAACLKLSELMWNKVLGDGGLLESVRALHKPEALVKAPPESAEILEFSRADRGDDDKEGP